LKPTGATIGGRGGGQVIGREREEEAVREVEKG